MYPVNKPNQYNKPQERPRFSLKTGRWFWMSSIMKTYNKATHQEQLKKIQENIKED